MVITMAILLVLLLINMFNSFITSEALRYIFDWLSIFARYQNFSYGLFDVGALFYYISVAGAFIFLTVRVFHARRSN
jgi:ABC-2 type transport system permease protein